MNFSKEVIKGMSWTGALRGSTRILSLIKTIFIARFLTPDQFGVYGIAMLILGFLELSTETGVNVFLIQKKESIDKYINTAWASSILRGLIMCLVIIVFSVPVANFFKTPSARGIIILAGLVPLARGFINPSIVKFQKNLEFNKEFWIKLAAFLFDTAFGIGFAYFTRWEGALIVGMIIGALVEVVISFLAARPTPRLGFNSKYFGEIISRGKWMTGAGIFDYVFHHLDDLVVGKILGAYSLGLYQQAYKISNLPVIEGGQVISRVTFPSYVKISHDPTKLKKAFVNTLLLTSLLMLAFAILVFIFAEDLVLWLLGNQWLASAGVLRVLVVFGFFRSISNSILSLFLSVGKQEYVTFSTLASIIGLGIVIFPLTASYGIMGAAYSAIIGSLVAFPLNFYYLSKILRYEKT